MLNLMNVGFAILDDFELVVESGVLAVHSKLQNGYRILKVSSRAFSSRFF
jgi:hypothetical protein